MLRQLSMKHLCRHFCQGLLLSAILLLSTSCAHLAEPETRQYELYCGLSCNDGKQEITAEDWNAFCEQVVSRHFPDGYTVLDATGYWRPEGQTATCREASKVIIILADASADDKIRQVASEYCRRCRQESVLVVSKKAVMSFIQP